MILNLTTNSQDENNLRAFEISESELQFKITEDSNRFSFAYISYITDLQSKAITTVDLNKNNPNKNLCRTWFFEENNNV